MDLALEVNDATSAAPGVIGPAGVERRRHAVYATEMAVDGTKDAASVRFVRSDSEVGVLLTTRPNSLSAMLRQISFEDPLATE